MSGVHGLSLMARIRSCLLLAAVSIALAGCGYDARFESSDGLWWDSTLHFPDPRQFRDVVWSFESYRYHVHDPALTLVRVTPRPRLFWIDPSRDNLAAWRVPYRPPSGRAPHQTPIYGSKPDETAEISRRADKAYRAWEKGVFP